MNRQETSGIEPFWSVPEGQIIKIFNNHGEAMNRQKSNRIEPFWAFQKVKFQKFLQPW